MVVAIFEIFEELFSRLQPLPYRYRCLRQALLKLSKLLSRLCEIGQCKRQNNLVPSNEQFLHTQKQFSTINCHIQIFCSLACYKHDEFLNKLSQKESDLHLCHSSPVVLGGSVQSNSRQKTSADRKKTGYDRLYSHVGDTTEPQVSLLTKLYTRGHCWCITSHVHYNKWFFF